MAKTYSELNREIRALQVRAEAARQAEKTGVVERIRDAIAVYGITAEELGFGRSTPNLTVSKAGGLPSDQEESVGRKAPATQPTSAIKYADTAGNTWSGRGPRPKWLKTELAKGRSLESFVGEGSQDDRPLRSEAKTSSSRAKPLADKSAAKKEVYKPVIKFRDSDGHTWSGRGPKPAWFMLALQGGTTPEQLVA